MYNTEHTLSNRSGHSEMENTDKSKVSSRVGEYSKTSVLAMECPSSANVAASADQILKSP